MSKQKKILAACVCMIGIGFLLCGAGYAMGGRVWGVGFGSNGIWVNSPNVSRKSISSENDNNYLEEAQPLEGFISMEVSMRYGDLSFEPSDHFGISYCVNSADDFSVKVEDGCLKVVQEPRPIGGGSGGSSWILVGVGSPGRQQHVKIYFPQESVFDKVEILNDSGKVKGSGICASRLEVYSGFGNIELEKIESEKASVKIDNGDLKLKSFSDGELTVESGFGKAELESVDGRIIAVTMGSGNFSAADMNCEQLLCSQDFGKASFENVRVAGEMRIDGSSGNIELTDVESGYINLKSGFGDVKGENVSMEDGQFDLDSGKCIINGFDVNALRLISGYGDVRLALTEPVREYEMALSTDYGHIKVDKEEEGEIYKSAGDETGAKRLEIHCDSGNIAISGTK